MNGLQGSHTVVDEEQPTERTSLLRRPAADRRTGSDHEEQQGPELLPIDSVVSRLQEEGLPADQSWCPDIPSPTVRTAFLLVTLLQLQSVAATQTAHTDDTWEEWSREQQNVETLAQTAKHISDIWAHFVAEPRTSEEVEQALWTRFRVSAESSQYVGGKLIYRILASRTNCHITCSCRPVSTTVWFRRTRQASYRPPQSLQYMETGPDSFARRVDNISTVYREV